MPMIPSPLAAGVYTAVKLVGYAAFSYYLNRVAGKTVSPYKFAAVKTTLGLVGGIAYVFFFASAIGLEGSDLAVWVGAIPIRLLVWSIVLSWFYGFRQRPVLTSIAIMAGVVWSYVLDGLMSFFYQVLPGMDMPFC